MVNSQEESNIPFSTQLFIHDTSSCYSDIVISLGGKCQASRPLLTCKRTSSRYPTANVRDQSPVSQHTTQQQNLFCVRPRQLAITNCPMTPMHPRTHLQMTDAFRAAAQDIMSYCLHTHESSQRVEVPLYLKISEAWEFTGVRSLQASSAGPHRLR